MRKFDEIEELFRNGLENLEVEPAPGTWQSIQSRIPASPEATASSSSAGWSKVLIAAGVVSATSVALVYFSSNQTAKNNTADIAEEQKNNTEITVPEIPGELNTPETGDEPAGNSAVKVSENNYQISPSVANGFMTSQRDKENLLRKNYNESGNTHVIEKKEETDKTVNKPADPQPEKTEVAKPVTAKIIADKITGTAPLKVKMQNNSPASSYEWSISDGTVLFDEKAEYTFETPGKYEVTLSVKDNKGNSLTDKIIIEVIEPSSIGFVNQNIFTPNGDGTNDNFRFDCKNIDKLQIQIVNLKGEIVFQSSDPGFQWDGRDAAGNLCPRGTYYYTCFASGTDGQVYRYSRKSLVLQ